VTNTAKTWLIVGIIAAALLLIACVITIACLGIIGASEEKGKLETPSVEAPVAPEAETPPPETPEPSGGVTLANFNRVETGMNYAEVSAIFGAPGELTAQSELAGYKTEIYTWQATRGFGNATITFSNGKLMSKAQIGLE
jgi:hypothetical protein